MLNKSRPLKRNFVVLGAILIQLALGNLYAWSVFTTDLKEAGWSNLETQMVFSIGLVTFALVMIFAGKKINAWGPGRLTLSGGLLLGMGYILSGLLGATNFWVLSLGIGLMGGAGIGLAYVVPIAVGIRWFPDKKGMITGLAVAGFGFGALGWVKLAGSWGNLIESIGLSGTFLVYGFIYAGLVILGSRWMVFPPDDYKPAGYVDPKAASSGEADRSNGAVDFNNREMLSTRQFYMVFLTFAFSSGAGLMAIGLMKLYPIQALQNSGIAAERAGVIAGTAMAVFFSLANGLGRIAWGWISDHMSRRIALTSMTAFQGLIVILFTFMAGNEYLLYLGATLIGFNYGGAFALFPAVTADFFGTKTVGQNYPFVFLAYGLGGLLGPIMGGMLGDMGNFPLAFTICGVLVLGSAIMIYFAGNPKKETEMSKRLAVAV